MPHTRLTGILLLIVLSGAAPDATPGALSAARATQLTRLGGMNANPSWSSDGLLLAFDSDAGLVAGRRALRILNLETGEVRQITTGQRDQAPRWSPDDTRILFDSFRDGNAEIYASAADGSAVSRLTDSPFYDSGGAWSPDGRSIVWFSGSATGTDEDDYGESDIWRMNADGSGKVRLTSGKGSDTYPAWSPDGRRIVFTSHRDGNAELYLMNADGSGLRRLTNHPASDDHSTWSRDGGQICFTSWRGGIEQLYVIDVDAPQARPVRLATGTAQARNPDWSPVGDRVAFFAQTGAGSELYAVDVIAEPPPARPWDDRAELANVTQSGADDTQPAWSPDGGYLAFVSDRSTDADWAERAIFFLDLETGGVGRMRRSRGDTHPDWSPDGSRMLVTSSDRDDVPRMIWQRTDGRFTQAPHRGLPVVGRARWSPDSRWIAFATPRPADARSTDIAISRPDGSELSRLVVDGARNVNPSWSPDGSRLAFTSSRDGNLEIYVVEIRSRAIERLTFADGSDDAAAWSPDGSLIAFMSERTGNFDVFVMSADGAGARNLSEHEAYDGWPAWSPDGARLAFASRRSGNSEIHVMRVRRVESRR